MSIASHGQVHLTIDEYTSHREVNLAMEEYS